MQLFWYQRPNGNFGDDLNPWLWPRLLPGMVDGKGAYLIGIGTLLNERLPASGEIVVLGAGAGYGLPPIVDDRWRILGVRGPLTAELLGLPPERAIGDPAILAADFTPPCIRRRGIGFMPHYASMEHFDWRSATQTLGLEFVDPQAPVEVTLAQIAGLESLLTEAMHGAILADALRTPWVGLAIDAAHYAFKWRDWGLSVEVEPRIHAVTTLSDVQPNLRHRIKRAAIGFGLGGTMTPPPRPPSPPALVREALRQITVLAIKGERQLSDAAALDRAKARVRAALAELGLREAARPSLLAARAPTQA